MYLIVDLDGYCSVVERLDGYEEIWDEYSILKFEDGYYKQLLEWPNTWFDLEVLEPE